MELRTLIGEQFKVVKEDPVAARNEIKLNHFGGRIVPLTLALSSFAAQENCDSEEYDTMQKAAEYITYLEGIVNVKTQSSF